MKQKNFSEFSQNQKFHFCAHSFFCLFLALSEYSNTLALSSQPIPEIDFQMNFGSRARYNCWKRPGVEKFLDYLFELEDKGLAYVAVWTASSADYADKVCLGKKKWKLGSK